MNKTKIWAPGIAIVMVLMLTTAAALLATPVLAGPNFAKHVASLNETGTDPVVRCGQAIFNTNFEDDPEYNGYELEVEVEECMALANSTVNVSLNTTVVGTIDVDLNGDGKATFYVDAISTGATVTVEGDVTLTGDTWRDWVKGRGKK